MKKNLLSALATFFFTLTIIAQDISFPVLTGFKIRKDFPVFVRDNLSGYSGESASLYISYGVTELHLAEYRKGRNLIKVEVSRYKDNAMAFGSYSAERLPTFRFVNLGAQGYISEGVINFLKGQWYVKIRTNSGNPRILKAEESLAARLSVVLPGDSKIPEALFSFPDEGRKSNEETFIAEKVLGHSFLTGAFRASYQVGSDIFQIYLFEKDTSDEATRAAETYIASTGISPVASGDSKFMLADGYNGTIFLAWKDRKLVVISGLAKDQADIADKYISRMLDQP